ncbi:MAG: homocysteine S-methyltransferase family protein, partial [Spirochaetota bacterium]|nr:homocysteine S-methyltransferase family protein [Spirochaetota bacterium]
MTSRLLQELEKRILILDGAMGSQIHNFNLSAKDFGGFENCIEYLTLSRPDVIETIHRNYLEAGADIIETSTFGGSRLKLGEHGLADRVHEINSEAAKLSRRVADEYSSKEKPRFVLGSMGPTGFLPSSDDPELGNMTFNELSEIFEEQTKALIDGGVDGLLIETSQDILEVKAAIHGIQKHLKKENLELPIIAQISLDTSGRMLLGTDIGSALTTIESLGVSVVGMNCSTGPQHMREPARYLGENSLLKLSCAPNAGIPVNEGGKAVFPLGPEDMAHEMLDFVKDFGINIVGGCCGTTPEHIRKLSESLSTLPPKKRQVEKPHFASSSMKTVSLEQEPRPLIVGERLNSQGSRKVKELLLAQDYNAMMTIARDQQAMGAHVLDVCVALTEREDEAETMRTVVKKLALTVDSPIMIDSTDYDVIKTALRAYPGSAMINSINLENGRERVEAILPLAKEYGASVVALTIDEEGMAKTAERKIAIAKRIHDIYTREYGLDPKSLLFDVLTFTLATGEEEWRNSAIETLKAIRQVKEEIPSVLTILGLSNVSFGLKPNARKILNSVFLYHAVKEGLDAAIVNPKDIIPYPSIPDDKRTLAEDLIYNRTDDALMKLSAHFEGQQSTTSEAALIKEEESLSVEEAIHHKILHRIGDGVEELLDEAMEKHAPVDILNDILLGAMKEVGDKFGTGELILPFVLQSAEVMKRAVNYLEGFLERKEGQTKATVLLATVYGDVHDIGKNLVKTILSNNGYTVHDIGKQVPVNTIIEKAVEHKVDAIGLSALLVSTSKQMAICVEELSNQGHSFPVLIGGAAINKDYGRRISVVGENKPYAGGVFYAKDAFEGLDIMDSLSNNNEKDNFIQKVKDEAIQFSMRSTDQKEPVTEEISIQKSAVRELTESLSPPFWGVKTLSPEEIDLK